MGSEGVTSCYKPLVFRVGFPWVLPLLKTKESKFKEVQEENRYTWRALCFKLQVADSNTFTSRTESHSVCKVLPQLNCQYMFGSNHVT